MVTRTVSSRYAVQHATATTAAARTRTAAGGVPIVITRIARATRTAGTTASSRATTRSRTTISATCRVSACGAAFAMTTAENPPFGAGLKTGQTRVLHPWDDPSTPAEGISWLLSG